MYNFYNQKKNLKEKKINKPILLLLKKKKKKNPTQIQNKIWECGVTNACLNTSYKMPRCVPPPTPAIRITGQVTVQQVSGPANEMILC